MKWIGQLWRGEIALSRAFWVFGVLVSIVLVFAIKALSMAVMLFMLFVGFTAGGSDPSRLLKGSLFVILTMVGINFAYQVVACIGIWRSADRYTGNAVYANLAKGAAALLLALTFTGIAISVYVYASVHLP